MAARPDSEDIAMDDAPTSHQPEVKDDTMVDDAGEDVEEEEDYEEEEEEEEEEEVQRVKLLPGSTETAASFEFSNEGHTLGNALRYVIMRKIRMLIPPSEGTTAIEALEKGLRDIQELCDVVTDKFVAAADDFEKKKAATA
ncbi:uncharacterized protein PODANS_7_8179 [Podospora anserina S mat+]|uniref:Podospora anserina S mat+ genomic DNA chromosome 7, supercontig 1 n=1 Tax=Podospora anserina (strain S / ATCC MYA-4624 / DSM 980 / FGSC 10383) TaxID=515849 RepID=B2AWS6_PODAN|nr:uncharacterized protein PODANS_7_8179 [Podospora anserina S mat+]CAP68850.1 unnamed protein product [Podospora anserina S mat+]